VVVAVRHPPDEQGGPERPPAPVSSRNATAESVTDRRVSRDTWAGLALAADAYAARGWLVFRLLPRSKEPFRRSNGFKDATSDRRRLAGWWQETPRANIGVATGPGSGLYVVDLDDAKGGFSSWARIEARYGNALTLEQETGSGGAHLVFEYPAEGTWPNTHKRLGPGVDTRGAGGYIMVAPSIHPNGRAYRWCTAYSDPQPAPGWLLELLADEPPAPEVVAPIVPAGERADRYWLAALRGEVDAFLAHPAKVEGGQGRNWRLHLAACRIGRLEAHGAQLDVAEDALVQAAMLRGIRQADARRQIRNGFAWGRTHPRGGVA
jgi:Bifunctional DNA primase/polymerase, N-terminal